MWWRCWYCINDGEIDGNWVGEKDGYKKVEIMKDLMIGWCWVGMNDCDVDGDNDDAVGGEVVGAIDGVT